MTTGRTLVVTFVLGLAATAIGCTHAERRGTAEAPACSADVAVGPGRPADSRVPVGGAPFGLAVAGDGRVAFVAVNVPTPAPAPAEIVVVDLGRTPPTVIHRVPVATQLLVGAASLGGAVLTHDGRFLLVADGDGVLVVDAGRARSGDAGAVLGQLEPRRGPRSRAFGTVQVAVSPDDRYVAASEEDHDSVTLYDLRHAAATGFADARDVAQVAVSPTPTGLAFSPDGRRLLVVSQRATTAQTGARPVPGVLSVLDVGAAISGGRPVVRAKVGAGCDPVRVAVGPDGRTVWVTARGSNALLALDLAKAEGGRSDALQGWVRVGSQPVGVALSADGAVAAVADSNRFIAPDRPSTITLVDTTSVLAGHPRLLGTVPAGGFPREVALSDDGGRFVATDFGTGELTVVSGR